MPEGPEVKVIADSLKEIIGFSLIAIEYSEKSRYTKVGLPEISLPRKILDITTKGKKIIFHLSGKMYIVSSLMMEGRWMWESGKHSDLWLDLKKGITKRLYFDDSRHFGTFEILDSQGLKDRLKEIGPDLLSDEIDISEWRTKIRGKRIKGKKIAFFLMEQKYFSGIGNYLRAEILYAAQISPHRQLKDLTDDEVDLLFECSRDLIKQAYESHGLTIATYWDPYGRKGEFAVKVYGKKYDPEGNPVLAEKLKDSRTIHWVPNIQT